MPRPSRWQAHLHRAGVTTALRPDGNRFAGNAITLTAGRIRSRPADRPDEKRTHAAVRRADGRFPHDSHRNLRICARHKLADSLDRRASRPSNRRRALPPVRRHSAAAAVPPLPQESAAARTPAAAHQNERSKHVMRIAVTYENGTVFQHFGHTAAVQALRCRERRRSPHSAGESARTAAATAPLRAS